MSNTGIRYLSRFSERDNWEFDNVSYCHLLEPVSQGMRAWDRLLLAQNPRVIQRIFAMAHGG